MESIRKRTCYSKVTYLPYETTTSPSPFPKGPRRSESPSLTAPPDLWTVNITTGTAGWTGLPIPPWQQIHTREALYPQTQCGHQLRGWTEIHHTLPASPTPHQSLEQQNGAR